MRFDFPIGGMLVSLALVAPGAHAGAPVTARVFDAGAITLASTRTAAPETPVAVMARQPQNLALPVTFTGDPAAGISRVAMAPIQAAPGGGASDNLYVDWVSPLQLPVGTPADAGGFPASTGGAVQGAAPGFASAPSPRAQAVPEPSALSLLATTMLPLAGMAWRVRRKDRA